MPDINLGTIYTQMDMDISQMDAKVAEVVSSLKAVKAAAADNSNQAMVSDTALQKAGELTRQIRELSQAYVDNIDAQRRAQELLNKPTQNEAQNEAVKEAASYLAELQQDLGLIKGQIDEVSTAAKNLTPYKLELIPESQLAKAIQYQKELESLNQSLGKQRLLVRELEQEASPAVTSNLTPQQTQAIAEANLQLGEEKKKLQELETQFNTAQAAQQKFIASQQKVAQAETGVAGKLDLRQAGANAKAGTDLVAAGLRTINQVAPGAAGNVDLIITQVNAMRAAMNQGASMPMKWALGISAAVAVATTVITALVNHYKKMREEQERAFNDGIQKSQEYAQKTASLTSNLAILENETSTTEKLKHAREELTSMFPELILGYDSEGKAILANNDAIREQIELYRQKQEAARQDIVDNGDVYADRAESLREQIAALKDDIARDEALAKKSAAELYAENPYETETSVRERLASEQEELKKLEREYGKVAQSSKQYYQYTVEGLLEVKDANGKAVTGIENLDQRAQTAARQMLKTFGDLFDGFLGKEELQGIADQINDMLGDPQKIKQYATEWDNATAAAQKQANLAYILTEQYGQQEAGVADLSDAYQKLASGTELSKEELQKLAQTFPTIKEYLQQTEDLSLDAGKVIAQTMGEIDYSKQVNDLNDLATAYGKLSDGQQLSVQQLYDLAAAYPEVAEYLQRTGDTTLNNGEVLKDLFEIRKQVYIQELEADRDEMIAAQNKSKTVIEEIQKQITAYGELAAVRGGSLSSEAHAESLSRKEQQKIEDEIKKVEGLQTSINEANARIETLKSKAASIDTFGGAGSAGKSKSKKSAKSTRNEALAEELKQLDHLDKMERINDEKKLARLREIQKTYQQNGDERMDLEYRIFSLEKKIEEARGKSIQGALNEVYDQIDYQKQMAEMSPSLAKEAYESLKRLQEQYKYIPVDQIAKLTDEEKKYILTKEQELDLNYRIYQAEKQLAEARKDASQKMLDSIEKEFSHREAMGEDVTQAELARLEELQRKVAEIELKKEELLTEEEWAYRLTAEQKMDLDEKVYALRMKLAKAAKEAEQSRYSNDIKRIEHKVSLGKMSTEEEIKQLEKLKRKYRKNKEIQMELEIKLYNLKNQLRQNEISAVDSLADAITEALRNRYEEQRKAEQDRINESIKSWQDWEEETVAAIQGQIDALDELDKQQDREEKRREYERKKQALSLQLVYEKDDYQRKQYQQELARLEAEEQQRQNSEAREAERKRLEEEMKKAQEESQKQQEALQDQLDKVNEEYDKMTGDFQLRAEAEKAIMENTQKEIVELIKSYAPEYDLAGQTIGEKLADGFQRKFQQVVGYVESVTKQITNYQNTLIDQANAAADKFYQAHQNQEALPKPPASLAAAREAQPVQVTVNFNQPVESPVETRRAVESVMNEIARKIG